MIFKGHMLLGQRSGLDLELPACSTGHERAPGAAERERTSAELGAAGVHGPCQPRCSPACCFCVSDNIPFFYAIKSEWSCFSLLVFLIL